MSEGSGRSPAPKRGARKGGRPGAPPKSQGGPRKKSSSAKPARPAGARPSRGSSGPKSSGGGPQRGRQRDERGGQRVRPDHLGGDIVEGRQAVRELLRVGRRSVQEVVVAEEVGESAVMAEIQDLAEERRIPYKVVSRKKVDEQAFTEAHQGVIATATPLWPTEFEDLLVAKGNKTPFLLALDGVTDPGNLGAILRTAEVVGATGVVLPKHRAARLSPAAVKAAAGSVEHLRIALVGGLPTALQQAADQGMWVIGLDGGAPESVYEMKVADQPLVLVLGAEGRGLSSLTARRCHQIVGIPQFGRTESLNVSVAAAVACYEVQRRRLG
ncbi:MAG: 23S rRNA (guanosine2251-2'-O)-methyltransferase [Candidatus Poriferisodalaceae bacterium]|jgi:23S rRNA (guanosine2251-2'-O)-methyltransferase